MTFHTLGLVKVDNFKSDALWTNGYESSQCLYGHHVLGIIFMRQLTLAPTTCVSCLLLLFFC